MKIRTNNKGLSLVEMMVSIAILSVVMIGVFGILAAMSKSFSISQKEVQLQDSVQNTYSIVSDIIKEAQTSSNSSIQSVQFDSANNKAYVIDDDTNDWTQSKFYIVELDTSTHILYLYSDSLYATATVTVTPVPTVSGDGEGGEDTSEDDSSATPIPTTTAATKTEKGSMVDYKSINVKSLTDKDSYLLSKNVKTFSVDVSSYGDGYVVVGLELEYGTRTASITQNVYLRNSNNSVLASGSTGTTPTPSGLEGYKLKSITNVTINNNKKFTVGDKPKAENFTVTAEYVSETDSTDVKEATLTDYACDKFGTELTTVTDAETLVFIANENKDVKCEIDISVSAATLAIEYDDSLFTLPDANYISTHSEINTYFNITSKDDANKGILINKVWDEEVNDHYECKGVIKTNYKCNSCNKRLTQQNHECSAQGCWTTNNVVNDYHEETCGKNLGSTKSGSCGVSGCTYQYYNGYSSDSAEWIEAGTKTFTKSFTVESSGEGMFSIINDSSETDYADVDVIVYITNSNTGFYNLGSGYLTLINDGTYAKQKVTYYAETNSYSDYLKIHIDSMPKYDGTDNTTYTFKFNWVSDTSLNIKNMAMAVYSEDAD